LESLQSLPLQIQLSVIQHRLSNDLQPHLRLSCANGSFEFNLLLHVLLIKLLAHPSFFLSIGRLHLQIRPLQQILLV
jgi:hypothetical protein